MRSGSISHELAWVMLRKLCVGFAGLCPPVFGAGVKSSLRGEVGTALSCFGFDTMSCLGVRASLSGSTCQAGGAKPEREHHQGISGP